MKVWNRILALILTTGIVMSGSGLTVSAAERGAKEGIAVPMADESQVGSELRATMFSTALDDNTWLFGGGIETQGRFAEIGSLHNYIGHFEEHVRGWQSGAGTSWTPQAYQRYMMNVGKAGCDAVEFAASLENYIEKTDPKAVAYLIGPEDYSQGNDGIEAFQTALSSMIQTSLAMKENKGYIVIQLPHAVKDSNLEKNVEAYAAAAKDVFHTVSDDDKKRIALVDHLALTQTDSFKQNNLTDDLLNATGHLEIARQLSQIVRGSTSGFTGITKNWTAEETPDVYRKEIPKAVISQNDLNVTVPEQIKASSFEYRLTIQGTAIRGAAYQNPFVIQDLPAGEKYELLVLCKEKDTVTQLSLAEGVVADGDTAKRKEVSGELAEAIRQKAEGDQPLTWLFMGDSITHGHQYLGGYDAIARLFEKYLKEDLGRTDDIVVNTAVSGATTGADTTPDQGGRGTLSYLEQRMAKYKPDIVSVMLGTNDEISDKYNANLKTIVEEIRKVNEDAIIIFRSPTPAKYDGSQSKDYATKLSGPNGSVARMEAVAKEDETGILFIDQYTEWNKEFSAYTYLWNPNYYFGIGDGYVHPGAAGHVHLTKQFIRECGLDTNTQIANLSYQFAYTNETSNVVPDIAMTADKDGFIISKTALDAKYTSGSIGDMTVVLTDAEGRTYTKELGLDSEEAIIYLQKNRRYTVNVTAKIKGSAAKIVTFEEQEILLGEETENEEDRAAANAAIAKINAIGTITGSIDAATKQAIETAREAYEQLSEEQKALVPNAAMKALSDAEAALDQQEANAVITRINGLGDIADQEITDEKAAEIQAAVEAYESLTDRQKSFISDALREQLKAAENMLNQFMDQKAANAVSDAIQAIGTVENTAACKQKIDAARAAYEALTDTQKALISGEILNLLTEAEDTYLALENQANDQKAANEVSNKIQAIGTVENTAACKQKIDAARAAYNALTNAQKALISGEILELLTNAENTYLALKNQANDQKAANEVLNKIQAIGTVENTAACKQKIDAARAAYNALTDAQKTLISATALKLLTDAEASYLAFTDQKEITVGNYLYRITGNSTAEAAGIKTDKGKAITIPATVKIGDKDYRVTSIRSSAFSKKKITGITIGKNVETIGKNAFAGCKKLKKVTVKSTKLKEIESKAFQNCTALKNITIQSKVLKKVGANCFKGIYKKAVIKVPSSKYKAYAKLLAKKGQSRSVKIKQKS